VFTYTAGGVAAGFLSWRLGHQLDWLPMLHTWLAGLAGLMLVVQGRFATGLLDRFRRFRHKSGCLLPSLFSGLLGATRLHSAFLAGAINGLLPCGLVYGYLALAASTADLGQGALTMALFGLGTVPLMVAVGCGGQWLSMHWRVRVLRLAAWCVVLTGVLCLVRAVSTMTSTESESACPLCQVEP
jgi:hypothetical protein